MEEGKTDYDKMVYGLVNRAATMRSFAKSWHAMIGNGGIDKATDAERGNIYNNASMTNISSISSAVEDLREAASLLLDINDSKPSEELPPLKAV